MRLDEAIVEELARFGQGTRKEIVERLAGRMQHALDRLANSGKIYKLDGPYAGNEKVYSLSPRLVRPISGPIYRRV
jgi:hypothetical protein